MNVNNLKKSAKICNDQINPEFSQTRSKLEEALGEFSTPKIFVRRNHCLMMLGPWNSQYHIVRKTGFESIYSIQEL